MTTRFRLDGAEYAVEDLSADGRGLIDRLEFANLQMQTSSNQRAQLISLQCM